MALSATAPGASGSASSARPLLVPAADVLARNMRAVEHASDESGVAGNTSQLPSLFIGLGAINEESARKSRKKHVRFKSAAATAKPNPISSLISRLFASKSTPNKSLQPPSTNTTTPPKPSSLQKIIPALQKAVPLISRLPDPLFVLLTQTLGILIVAWVRPHCLCPLAVRISLCILLFVPILLSLVWKRSELFSIIQDNRPIRTHPAELRLDGPEAEVRAREAEVEKALEALRKNEADLDALKKELAKEGNSRNADGQIIPSRRAGEMIAAGALGTSFDAETTAHVEQRRRQENMLRSREEWNVRAEMADDDDLMMNESLKRLAYHAATTYSKRSQELKIRSSPGANRADKFSSNFKSMVNAGRSAARRPIEDDTYHLSRHSERSMPISGDNHSSSRRRLTLFRRKRRDTAPELDARLTVSDDGHMPSLQHSQH